MRIGLCGSVSVGKSTLVKHLATLPEFKDYFIATERSKYLRDLGIPLNNDSTVRGQMVFMAERASELLNDNLITDRTIYCVCSFTLSSKTITNYEKRTLVEAAMNLNQYYDIVFYISPEGIPIEDNGIRTTDSKYREQIDFAIKELLKEYPPKKLIQLSGSTEERCNRILEEIKIH